MGPKEINSFLKRETVFVKPRSRSNRNIQLLYLTKTEL